MGNLMNLFPLDIMRIFKRRNSRLSAKPAEAAPATPDSAYTLVDPVPGGRKLNLLNGGHLDGKMLDQSRSESKSCKARWLTNKTEQKYTPRTIKVDPQLEFYYENMGLNQNGEQTVIGNKPQA